eukprot:gene13873-16363_t
MTGGGSRSEMYGRKKMMDNDQLKEAQKTKTKEVLDTFGFVQPVEYEKVLADNHLDRPFRYDRITANERGAATTLKHQTKEDALAKQTHSVASSTPPPTHRGVRLFI